MIKYDDKINDIECNLTLNSSDISTDLKELLLDIIRDKTRCYYDYAHANKNSLDDIFGLQIYKDYYRTINLIYKGNDNEFHEDKDNYNCIKDKINTLLDKYSYDKYLFSFKPLKLEKWFTEEELEFIKYLKQYRNEVSNM